MFQMHPSKFYLCQLRIFLHFRCDWLIISLTFFLSKAPATRSNIVKRTLPNIVIRTLLTMLDTHINFLKHVTFTTLLKGRRHVSTFVVCTLEKMFDRNHNILPTKNIGTRHQTCMLHDLTLLIQQMFYNND